MAIIGVDIGLCVVYACCYSQLQSLAGDLQLVGVEGQMDGKLYALFSVERGTDGEDLPVCARTCSSAHDCGCVVNGSSGWKHIE